MLVVERREPAHQALGRALVLARHFRARLELVLYEGEFADSVTPAQGAQRARVLSGIGYLEALRSSISDPGVEILLDVVAGNTLHEAVVHTVLNRCPDLVVRAAHADAAAAGDFLRADMRLVRACPAPVLLTSGRPWHARPRLAALVDLFDRHGPAMPRAVAAMGARLREGCAGDLEILYAAQDGVAAAGALAGDDARSRASDLAHQCGAEAHGLPVMPASTSLAQFVGLQGFDVLIHGVPDPDPPLRALLAMSRQQAALADCDLLFVRPGRYQSYDRLPVG